LSNIDKRLYILLTLLCVAIIVVGSVAVVALWEGAQPPTENTIMVTGTGTVRVAPNEASISLGVETRAETAEETLSSNSARMARIAGVLQDLGIPENNIKTSYFSLRPVYNYTKGYPELVGYMATNTLQVTTTQLDQLGAVIDEAVAAGASNVGGISFSIAEETEKALRDEALEAAAEDATSKAEKLAESMNVKIVGIKEISIGGAAPPSPYRLEVTSTPSTPVFPGEAEITYTVQVTYIIS